MRSSLLEIIRLPDILEIRQHFVKPVQEGSELKMEDCQLVLPHLLTIFPGCKLGFYLHHFPGRSSGNGKTS